MAGSEDGGELVLDLASAAEEALRQLGEIVQGRQSAFAEVPLAGPLEVLTQALLLNTQVLASFESDLLPHRSALAETTETLARLAETLRTDRPETPVPAGGNQDPLVRALALNTSLLLMVTSLGECRMDTPYSPVRPVIRADGTRVWCCNHNPEHCS